MDQSNFVNLFGNDSGTAGEARLTYSFISETIKSANDVGPASIPEEELSASEVKHPASVNEEEHSASVPKEEHSASIPRGETSCICS